MQLIAFGNDTIRVNIYFDTAEHFLIKEEEPKLDSLVDLLNQYEGFYLDLRGHTDSRGSISYNQRLSERRMETVRRNLEQRGVENDLMTKSAWSELQPAATNDNPSGMQLNRRVEIVAVIPRVEKEVTEVPKDNVDSSSVRIDEYDHKILVKFGKNNDKSFDKDTYEKLLTDVVPRQKIEIDSITGDTLDAQKTLVVMDWTRSMYHYGSNVYEWHIKNMHESTIKYLSFFNDGDSLKTEEKLIGQTEGIYYNKTVNEIHSVTTLMEQVAKAGNGGDYPENYIEVLIKSQQQFPDVDTIVLLADNRACIRDWQLLPDLPKKPIKVILCGVRSSQTLLNYMFVNLAAYTGGSVHVLGKEIKQLAFKDDNFYPETPRDTVIYMQKIKGKIRKVRSEQAKIEKKYSGKSRPPITMVNGEEYLFSRRTEVIIDGESFYVGKVSCESYDFRRTPEVTVIPNFTFGQKVRRTLKTTLDVSVFVVTLPVTLPISLIRGGRPNSGSSTPMQ